MVVVDTNVAVVANGHSEQASQECVQNCAKWLYQITNGTRKLVIDDKWQIIGEYKDNLRSTGQPGVGDAFLKWVLTNWRNVERCELVSITPIDHGASFKEFPTDSELINFDPDDRKFIAIALAHRQNPPILQAVDVAWWNFKDILLRNSIKVEFLCEDDIRRLDAKGQEQITR